MRRVFFDETYEHQLISKGYVILPLLNEEEIKYLLSEHSNIEPQREEAFYTSIWHTDKEYRERVNQLISEIIPRKLKTILNDYKPVFANFMIKKPVEKSTLDFHQDWTFVDESMYRAVNVWVPLIDTDLQNGALHVIEGSHKYKIPYRGRNIEGPYWHLSKYLRRFFSRPLKVSKGHAVIFDERLIHGSFDNQSNTNRIAISNVMAPRECQLYHFFKKDKGDNISKMKVNEDFFTRFSLNDEILEYAPHENFQYRIQPYNIWNFTIDFLLSKIQTNG